MIGITLVCYHRSDSKKWLATLTIYNVYWQSGDYFPVSKSTVLLSRVHATVQQQSVGTTIQPTGVQRWFVSSPVRWFSIGIRSPWSTPGIECWLFMFRFLQLFKNQPSSTWVRQFCQLANFTLNFRVRWYSSIRNIINVLLVVKVKWRRLSSLTGSRSPVDWSVTHCKEQLYHIML